MMFRIIWLLLIIGLGILFAGVNARNVTDISIIIHTWKGVPVYIGMGIAFILGVLWSIPFFFMRSKKKRISSGGNNTHDTGDYSSEETGV